MRREVDVGAQAFLSQEIGPGDVLRHRLCVLDSDLGARHPQHEIRLVGMNKGQRIRKSFSRQRRKQMRDAIAFRVMISTALRACRHINVQLGKFGHEFFWSVCLQDDLRHRMATLHV
ncbi:MAG: hypothetical protein B7X38_03635 [Stenotrophomonas sp. 14-69-23]|nr:MAG: hypothetical protein B7X38_03635 [Stenotrophomonas sp. 14-69-23]